MTHHPYSITTSSNIILVRKYGSLNMSAQLAYLSELAQVIEKYHGQSYYLLADMRGWTISEDNRALILSTDVRFDRRSQKGECWLVDNVSQTDHLLRFFTEVRFELFRTTLLQDVYQWANTHFDHHEADHIHHWLNSTVTNL